MEIFRGSESDVLGRYAGAAAQAGAGTVVRLTSDCPLLDPAIVDLAVRDFARGGADLVTTAPPQGRSYPDGMDVEVFARATLDRMDADVVVPALREHMTAALHARRLGECDVLHHYPLSRATCGSRSTRPRTSR